MNETTDSLFGLLTGFAYLHIGIAGIVGCFLAALVSMIVWWSRAEFVKGLAGAVVVVLVPLMTLGIIPGLEMFAVPVGLIAAALVVVTHLRRWKSPEGSGLDATITIVGGISVLAIAVAYLLGSLSTIGG